MHADQIRFLYAYDRWATRRVLSVLDGLEPVVWMRTDVVGERGVGAILVHHLGASQRQRHGFQDTGESPEPELDPLPTIDQLREGWELEWAAVDAWLPTVTDGFVGYVHLGGARLANAGARREPRDTASSRSGGPSHPREPIARRARPDNYAEAQAGDAGS